MPCLLIFFIIKKKQLIFKENTFTNELNILVMKSTVLFYKSPFVWLITLITFLGFSQSISAQELTENNAADWGTFANVDQAATSTVNNSILVQAGNYSVEFNTLSGFATGLYYPKQGNANWDLTEKTLSFAFYAINNTPIGFQEPVKVRLYTDTDYFEYVHNVNPASSVWISHEIQLNNDNYQNWTLNTVGLPNLVNISKVEFIFDTWDFGFQIFLDAVKFEDCLSTVSSLTIPDHTQYFIDMGSQDNALLNLDDFFEDPNCNSYQIIKRSPGLFPEISANTLLVTPTTNFMGSTWLELQASCGNTLYTDTIVVHTQMTHAMAYNCNKQIVNLGVYNFDPIMPQYNSVYCHEAYNWNDPIELTEDYIETITELSGNYVMFNLTHWQWINDWPVKSDGFTYDANSFDDCWIGGNNCHNPDIINYPLNIANYGVDEKVNNNEIDEVWFWGGPYFGYFESAMAGPGAYWINGTPYPTVNTDRPFAVMGFNYERGLAEMLHSNGHRSENHMKRAYNNRWNEANPQTNWDYFTANVTKTTSTTTYGVGNIHFPPNGASDYDYNNSNIVTSTALDWANYPNLTGATTQVNKNTWGGFDYHLNFMEFWFDLLPKVDGINTDGRMNNWWKYIYDFSSYKSSGESINTGFSIVNTIDDVQLNQNFGTYYIGDLTCIINDGDVGPPQISLATFNEGIRLHLEGNDLFAFSEEDFTGLVDCVLYICDGNFSDALYFKIMVSNSCVAEIFLNSHTSSEMVTAADLIESTAVVQANTAVTYNATRVRLLNGFSVAQSADFEAVVIGCAN